MKQLYGIATLVIVSGGSLFAAPCWSDTNSCGNTPACGPGEPGAGYITEACHHSFCDNAVKCPDEDLASNRVMRVDRTKYIWVVGEVVHTCVSAGTPSATSFCCNCNQPGILYEQ